MKSKSNALLQVAVRFIRPLVVTVVLAATLLAFPSAISFVVITGVLLPSLLLAFAAIAGQRAVEPAEDADAGPRHRPPISVRLAAAMLLALGCVLLIKYPENTQRFWLLVAGCLFTGAILLTKKMSLRSKWIELAVLWPLVIWFVVGRTADQNANASNALLANKDIIVACLGDSLTEAGYPMHLQSMRPEWEVLNFGRNGYTTTEAIRDLLPEIVAAQPDVVVIELGGHDYKNGDSREATQLNLQRIIDRVREIDGRVIIVEIPRGFIRDPWGGLERELARENDLQLIPDTIIRRFIFTGPQFPPGSWLPKQQRLSADNLHPNERGSIEFAKQVLLAIQQLQTL